MDLTTLAVLKSEYTRVGNKQEVMDDIVTFFQLLGIDMNIEKKPAVKLEKEEAIDVKQELADLSFLGTDLRVDYLSRLELLFPEKTFGGPKTDFDVIKQKITFGSSVVIDNFSIDTNRAFPFYFDVDSKIHSKNSNLAKPEVVKIETPGLKINSVNISKTIIDRLEKTRPLDLESVLSEKLFKYNIIEKENEGELGFLKNSTSETQGLIEDLFQLLYEIYMQIGGMLKGKSIISKEYIDTMKIAHNYILYYIKQTHITVNQFNNKIQNESEIKFSYRSITETKRVYRIIQRASKIGINELDHKRLDTLTCDMLWKIKNKSWKVIFQNIKLQTNK